MVKSKGGRRLWRFLLMMILGGLVYVVAVIGAIHIVGAIDTTEEADVIIVLGAGLRADGRPGWALTRRTQWAADLWHKGIAPYALCTGAQAEGFPRSEAAACREILLGAGLPDAAILMEESSRSTEENAIHSRRLLDELGLERAVLVSDSYHLLRQLDFSLARPGGLQQSNPRQSHPLSAFLSLFAGARICRPALAAAQGSF